MAPYDSFISNDALTTAAYTLSLHDALPILGRDAVPDLGDLVVRMRRDHQRLGPSRHQDRHADRGLDRKSTRLNSSHGYMSYGVFCLKKKITLLWCLHSLMLRSRKVIAA